MVTTETIKSNINYYDNQGRQIKIIKEGKRTIFKSINNKIILDFYAPSESRIMGPNEYTSHIINPLNIEKAENIMKTANNLLKNKKIKTAVRTLTGLVTILAITTSTLTIPIIAAAPAVQALSTAAEMQEVTKFITLVINAIRVLSVSICGLIAANAGLKILTEENTDGPKEAKKSFQKILWALFLTFAGTGLASLLAKRLLGGL